MSWRCSRSSATSTGALPSARTALRCPPLAGWLLTCRALRSLTSEDRSTRKAAIGQLREHLLAAAQTEPKAQRRLRAPLNPVALRAEAGLKSQQRPFALKAGDVVEVLEMRMVEGRERVRFRRSNVDCWASVRAGDGGVLLEDVPSEPVPSTVGGVDVKPGMLEFLLSRSQQPLARCLVDPVEKCRELAAQTVSEVVKVLGDATPLFDICMRAITQRLGQKQVEEPAEEIRLRLVALVRTFVQSGGLDPEVLASNLDAVCTVLKKMAADAFPDVKKECASCATAIVEAQPERIKHHAPSLAKALLPNTGHQHSRVRAATVDALALLVANGAETAWEELAPQFLVLTRDRTVSVRESMARAVGAWTLQYYADADLVPSLLRLLIGGVSDEAASVSTIAAQAFEAAAAEYQSAMEAAGTWEEPAQTSLPEPRPSSAATALLCAHLEKVLPVGLEELEDWTSKSRAFASLAMKTLLAYAGDAVAPHLGALLNTLYQALADDEPEVVKLVVTCVETAGVTISIDSWVPLVLEDITKHLGSGTGGTTLPHCVICFCVLLRGRRQSGLPIAAVEPHLLRLGGCLANPALCSHGTSQVQIAMLELSKEAIAAVSLLGAEKCPDELENSIFVSLMYALATKGLPDLNAEASNVLTHFAEVMGLPSAAALYQRHFASVLESLVADEGYRTWRSESPGRALFDVLLRGGGASAAEHMFAVLAIFADTLQQEREAEMRMGFLILLDTLCKNPLLRDCLQEESTPGTPGTNVAGILKHMVLPNLIWKPGRVAAKIRKAACIVLQSVAEGAIATPDDYASVAAKLFPPLLSALDDDYEPSTRAIVCKTFKHMFGILRGHMDEETCRTIYGDLLKRLDDNEDSIRIDAAAALASFIPCVPIPPGATLVEYTVQTLLVHLDDTNEEIRAAVLPALEVAARLCPAIVVKKTEEAMQRQRPAGAALSAQVLQVAREGQNVT